MEEIKLTENLLPKARYHYTDTQKLLISTLMPFIDELMLSGKELPEITNIKINTKILKKSGNELVEEIRDLMKKPINYSYQNENQNYEAITTLISHFHYEESSKTIKVELPKKSVIVLSTMLPKLNKKKQKIAIEINNTKTRVFYDLLNSCEIDEEIWIEIGELKERLGIQEKYNKYSAFKEYVLERSRNELLEKADLYYNYIEIKEGRKIESLILTVKKNQRKNTK